MKQPFYKRPWFPVICALIIIGALLGVENGQAPPAEEPPSLPESASADPNPPDASDPEVPGELESNTAFDLERSLASEVVISLPPESSQATGSSEASEHAPTPPQSAQQPPVPSAPSAPPVPEPTPPEPPRQNSIPAAPSTSSQSSAEPFPALNAAPDTLTTAGSGQTAYWVSGGKSHHFSKNCTSLKRSTNILTGTLEDALSAGKNDPCNLCAGG